MARNRDTIGSTPLEVFVPAAGQNPADPQDRARDLFFTEAQELLEAGMDIAVYSTDSYPSAFTDCEPVADQIAVSGPEVLPILLVEGRVKVAFKYPTAEQLRRFSRSGEVKKPKISAAAAACGTGGVEAPATVPAGGPAGFAAVLAGVSEKPAGGPDIGNRVNLMSGDFGDGIPEDGSSAAVKDGGAAASVSITQAMMGGGGCCGGSCGCGSK